MNSFERILDEKNRLTIPKEIRGEFEGNRVVVTPGEDNDLYMYPKSVWEEMQQALKGAGWQDRSRPLILDSEIRSLNKKLLRGMTETVMDAKQGRVVLEPHLLKAAGIEKAVTAIRMPAESGSYWVLERPQV